MLWLIKINTFKGIQQCFLPRKRRQDYGTLQKGVWPFRRWFVEPTTSPRAPEITSVSAEHKQINISGIVVFLKVGEFWSLNVTVDDGFAEMQSCLGEHFTIFSGWTKTPDLFSLEMCSARCWLCKLPVPLGVGHVTSSGQRDVTGSLLLVSGGAFDLFMGGGTCRWRSLSSWPFFLLTFYGVLLGCTHWFMWDIRGGHWLWPRRAAGSVTGQATSERMSRKKN